MIRLEWVAWIGRLAGTAAGWQGASLLWRQGRRLPLRVVAETETLLAFHHPRPAYRVHIVIVPKRPLPALTAVTAADTPFLADLFATTARLVAELDLAGGYRFIGNGGRYQSFPYLHFHLVSGEV